MLEGGRRAGEVARDREGETNGQLWKWMAGAVATLVVLSTLKLSFEPLRGGTPWMWFVEDDFFYYLKVAQNLGHGLGSTFNGLVPTNGYHPLWLLLLTGFCAITTGTRAVLLFLGTVSFLGCLATFGLVAVMFRQTGYQTLAAVVLSGWALLYSETMLMDGMEVMLTLPLLVGVMVLALACRKWAGSWMGWLGFGLMLSATVLSRLDSAFFVVLLALFALVETGGLGLRRLAGRDGLALGMGLTPVLAYLMVNHRQFGVWLPISGMAKQLKPGWTLAKPALRSAFDRGWTDKLVDLVVLAGLLSLPLLWRRLRPEARVVLPAALLFPFLHVGVLAVRSDWQLWPWYLYGFRVALYAAIAVLGHWMPVSRAVRSRALLAVASLGVLVALGMSDRSTVGRASLIQAGEQVAQFAQTHPGVYAMGDRSGVVGYLSPEPVVQTEGLVMDKTFLESIRRQEPLREVLARYGTKYYVRDQRTPAAECLDVTEPAQAGPASPHMRGRFCGQPLASFRNGTHYTYVYSMSQAVQ